MPWLIINKGSSRVLVLVVKFDVNWLDIASPGRLASYN